ncbi:hypothetical protein [uncultured Paraglaciecola sp.]|uniref:phage tail terminator protein n=1 Tax=uncultured Paraglaciecola sp. TaxID=1765024 RepID=UPI00261C24F6|nr:hypothetical protein [uncultured Paraglaciecola sp.]
MLLTDIQTRIKPCFKRVNSAVNIREAIKQPLNLSDAAFVVPVSERPAGNSRDVDIGNPLQEAAITFGVVMGIQSINDPTGENGLVALEQKRKQVREKLYGYAPTDHEPILLGAGDLVAFVPNGVWWIDRFTTVTWYQGQAQ